MQFEFSKLNPDTDTIAEIVKLRREQFKDRFGTAVDLDGLNWNRTDAASIHFGSKHKGRLISVLRLTQIESKEIFGITLQFPPDDPFVTIPCYALARAATAKEFKGFELNMQLRIASFRYVLAHQNNCQYIYGTALMTSKRIDFLKSIGYELLIHQQPWKGYLSSGDVPIGIFRIEVARLASAISMIEQSQLSQSWISQHP